ncbi:MAG: GNAT family N-acetyltransferase [Xanthobacteraceae bacterium]|nr:GNAT family N-acetyltransferase [Xanthobacteraceae bacterium]
MAADGHDIAIRRLTATDAAALQKLRLEALKAAPEAFSSSYDEEAARPREWFVAVAGCDGPDAVFGAFCADRLVGMAGFVVTPKAKQRHRGTLVGLCVQPSFRRRGAARRLLDAVIGHTSGCVMLLHATVTASNTAAQALYRQSGFVRFGTEPKAILVDGQFYDDDLLILDLSCRTP